jgi:hypothetical protein
MSKTKAVLIGLTVVCALSGVMATSALASSPEWWVNGKVISKEEKLNSKTTVLEPFVISTVKFSAKCKEVTIVNGVIRPGNTNNTIESLEFGLCEIASQPQCVLKGVKTVPLSFTLENPEKKEEANKINFVPKSGSLLAEFTITGAGCPVAGTWVIKSGAKAGMVCNYPGVEVESLEHELNFGEKSGSELFVNGEKATLAGIDHFSLASGNKWSVK